MEVTEQQLNRILYSGWDFQQALSALAFLLEECEYRDSYNKVELRRFGCYESTAIISFGRPFETSRGRTSLGLRTLGIQLSEDQKRLKEKLLYLRRKIVAHSDEEEMHFRVDTFDIEDLNATFAHFQYDEGLNLSEEEVRQFQNLLHFLKSGINKWLFDLAQKQPELLNKYKRPERSYDT